LAFGAAFRARRWGTVAGGRAQKQLTVWVGDRASPSPRTMACSKAIQEGSGQDRIRVDLLDNIGRKTDMEISPKKEPSSALQDAGTPGPTSAYAAGTSMISRSAGKWAFRKGKLRGCPAIIEHEAALCPPNTHPPFETAVPLQRTRPRRRPTNGVSAQAEDHAYRITGSMAAERRL